MSEFDPELREIDRCIVEEYGDIICSSREICDDLHDAIMNAILLLKNGDMVAALKTLEEAIKA